MTETLLCYNSETALIIYYLKYLDKLHFCYEKQYYLYKTNS